MRKERGGREKREGEGINRVKNGEMRKKILIKVSNDSLQEIF